MKINHRQYLQIECVYGTEVQLKKIVHVFSPINLICLSQTYYCTVQVRLCINFLAFK